MNKYEKWYNQITTRGQIRVTDQRTETHHIVPKCVGGSNDSSNLTKVTLREHFICHWLLTRIYKGKHRHQMLKALWMMKAENPNQTRYQTKITSRAYAKLKEEYSVLQSQRVSGENNPMYGDKFYRSEDGKKRQRDLITGDNNGAKKVESRKKMSDSKKGKKREAFSDEWRNNMSKKKQGKNNPRFGVTVDEKTKEKMRKKATGRKQSPETIQKKADAIRGSKREKKLCPHCGRMIAVNTYARWHGDQCRSRGSS